MQKAPGQQNMRKELTHFEKRADGLWGMAFSVSVTAPTG